VNCWCFYDCLSAQDSRYIRSSGVQKQTINGDTLALKTPSSSIASSIIFITPDSTVRGASFEAPSVDQYYGFDTNDKNGAIWGFSETSIHSDGSASYTMGVGNPSTSEKDYASIGVMYNPTNTADGIHRYMFLHNCQNLHSTNDNKTSLGQAQLRFSQLYAGTASINTSDERLKDEISEIPEEVLIAWGKVNFNQFKFKESIKEKGDKARLHTGLIAQRIVEIFEADGLNATKYGLVCYDSWGEYNIPDPNSENGTRTLPAGNLYSLRYEEALCLEAAYQRYRANKLEERIAALEAKLS